MLKALIYHLSIPMKQAFIHAQAKRTQAESIIFSVEHNGIQGIGECTPRKYVTGENIKSVIAAIIGSNISELAPIVEASNLNLAIQALKESKVLENLERNNQINATCAIEIAALDLLGKKFHKSIKDILIEYLVPECLGNPINQEKFFTSQVLDYSLTPEQFCLTRGPFRHVKIKLNNHLEENIHRVKTVRRLLGNDIPITLDANMAWDLNGAHKNISALNKFNIKFYEEPLQKGKLKEYCVLRRYHDSKILLDESLCYKEDAYKALENSACDAFNLRLSKCGGFIRTIDLLKIAHKHNLDYQIGSQVAETGPLIAASRQLIGAIHRYFTYETGQYDRFFDRPIITPVPLIDRTTNMAHSISGKGLGVEINSNYKLYLKEKFTWRIK